MGLQGAFCFPLGLLFGSLLLAASAPAALESPDCSDKEQQVTVSHTYRIDVPKSALVQVEADPPPSGDDGASLPAPGEADAQNIIFRHNIRLQTPPKDCALAGLAQDLLGRVKKLEEEMAEVKAQCEPQRCCQGAAGPGSEGAGCAPAACPGGCSGHGECVRGVCRCHADFTSEDCSERRCPGDCSGHGFCDTGECYCEEGFVGLDCAQVVAPQDLQLLKSTEESLQVGWTPAGEADHYLLSYHPLGAELSAEQVRVPGQQHSYEILGLLPGTKYLVTLRSVKKEVSSSPRHLLATTDPAVLGTAWVTDETEHSLDVEWENPPTEVDYYKLRYSPLGGQEVAEVTVPKSSDPKSRYDITGLQPGTEYEITVIPVTGDQEGKPIVLTGRTEIDGPANVVTDRVTEDTVAVSWEPVRAAIDKYVVRYTSADGEARDTAVPGERNSTVLTGLKPGEAYRVYVWAARGRQESRKADTRALTDIDSPRNLVTDQVTETTATVSWEPVQAAIDRYLVRYTSADGDSREVPVGQEQSSVELTGLRPGVEYTVRVWAERGARQSGQAEAKALTDLDPPRDFRPSAVTQSGGVLTWTRPSAQIDGYVLTYRLPDGTAQEVPLGQGDQRFELQGLEQGATYPVSLVAIQGDRRSRSVSTTLSTAGARFPHPADCSQVQQNSNAASGLYTIYLHGDAGRALQVYCDLDTDGGGWTVFQRRNTGQLDFFKRWRTYVDGFGDPTQEFWLGLDKLHNLTTGTPTPYEVRVDLQTANESAYAVYDFFQVASSRERYRLAVGKYRGTAGDALTYHNGWKFTTFDRDNDIALSNCALTHHGGWWYKNCHLANPNGRYGETKHSEGVNWEPWKGHEFSIPFVELKIRPRGFSGEHVLGKKRRALGEHSRTF